MYHTIAWIRLGAAVVRVAALLVAGRVPALAVLIGLVALTAAVNLIEGRLAASGRTEGSATEPAPRPVPER